MSCFLFENISTFLPQLVRFLADKNTSDHSLDNFILEGTQNTNDCAIAISSVFLVVL